MRGALVALLMMLLGCGHTRPGPASPIRRSAKAEAQVPRNEGRTAATIPLPHAIPPQHPHMAPHGASCMHSDSFTTNTYSWPGPLGVNPEVRTRAMGMLGGECPTVNFDRRGRIITVCVRERTPWLLLMDPDSLEVLARHALPKRRTPLLRLREIMQDTSGGAYFYLDQQDRAVVGTADGTIEVVATEDRDGASEFVVERNIDLKPLLRRGQGKFDKLTAVMPDFHGNYWFASRWGRVGVVNEQGIGGFVLLRREEIENAFSVSPEGVYVVSDHALYRFALDEGTHTPRTLFREPYDRGRRRKVGQINQGSGTTPTLLGDRYVAITDNAEPRMNVLVYKRGDVPDGTARLVCRVPVFEPHKSATENTMIGYGRTLIVENNAGYDLFRTMRGGKTSAPGLARIDVRADESGCDVKWVSQEIAQTAVPKLSTATGLVYAYTKRPHTPDGIDAYYFTAIDFETGETRFRVLTGTGVRFDNNWAAITLGRDGSAYVGVLNGLLVVRDRVGIAETAKLTE